ncbi:predicted hydrolase [Pelotomaculum thermopropionicum SI]|uniref:Predicted hydrolase n=1 Tax=Pelotomaculum thermopropionicum (strain DSM 13744 / JCM 10971 / SI) TaxID=370438 RepID=A5D3Z5_PELTS|nr:predicted hydrolase [Pelotomaculum thermopropionicum SI]
MDRPLVLLTAFYIAGILFGELTGFKASVALALAFFCFFTAVAGYLWAWKANGRIILALFLLLGLAVSRVWAEGSETPLAGYAGQRVVLVGRVAAEPDVRRDKVFYLLKAQEIIRGGERRAVHGAVRLDLSGTPQVYGYGDLLKVSGLLTRPEPPGNPGEFNYRRYLERQGIKVILLARGNGAVQKAGSGAENPVLAAALQVKQKLSAAATAYLKPSHAALLNGIVFGTQGLIEKETREAFTATGVVHILSVSGLHVGIVTAGLIGLLRFFGLPPGATAPAATPVLLFYALMTGLNPAVMRSTVMALLLLWAHHLGRDRDWPATLALAALIILLWNPFLLFHPGFQLSFAATWGILHLGPVLSGLLEGLFKRPPGVLCKTLIQGLAVSLAAQLATVPPVAWYYNLVSLVSVPANLIAVPLVGLVQFLGIAAAALGLLWLPLAGLVNACTGVVLELFLALISFFQRLPGAVVYLPTPPVLLAAAWYGGLLALIRVRKAGLSAGAARLVKGWAPAGAALAAALLIWWPWGGGHKLAVHFLDVGQGDSILLQTPGGRNMLIDTGGRKDEFLTGTGAGDQVVAPYLRKIGVNRLDVLVLTHPHEDHCGGAAYLVKNFPVGLAVVSPAEGTAKDAVPAAYAALIKEMGRRGVPVQAAAAGDVIRLDPDVDIEVLSPGAAAGGKGTEFNDGSLVLKVIYGLHSFILTGDIELESQRELIQRGVDLAADVMKVPHHGSRSLLPELVEQVRPGMAVISVGAHNTFGHPAPYALDLLGRAGARIYRTDQDGAVIVETDGNRLEVKTGKSGQEDTGLPEK